MPFRRESKEGIMEKNLVAEASVLVSAGPEKVWKALTDPELIKKYLFGTEAVSDWKVGSPIAYRGVWEGKAYEDKGTITELEPNRRFVSTYWSAFSGLPDKPENYATVTYLLEKEGPGTKLRVIQDNNASEEGRAHSEANWNKVLGVLKSLVEGGAAG
jgi:uncharacterized protein YndB with AHSA1/START domain